MRVITPSNDNLTVSPNATMTGLAPPSRGILPPTLLRRIHAPERAEAHVAMHSDALASVPGTVGTRELPWAR
ncbi:hypothetical protein [Streptomyces sp. 147326]|uniref:hypothetical protein n=1 Tax=Streptomyces sp. 147326 TaxID=3074379 RepID=UPI003857D339